MILKEKKYIFNIMVNSHACLSNYLQIDQETNSHRDESSSRHVSIHSFFKFRETRGHVRLAISIQEINI